MSDASPGGTTPSSQPDAVPEPPVRLWSGPWKLVIVADVALAAISIVWIAIGGIRAYVDNAVLQWLALAAVMLFIAVLWRLFLRQLQRGIAVDGRAASGVSGLWPWFTISRRR